MSETTTTPPAPPSFKPCPFCGSSAWHWHGSRPTVAVITHTQPCRLGRLTLLDTTNSTAVALWEKRA